MRWWALVLFLALGAGSARAEAQAPIGPGAPPRDPWPSGSPLEVPALTPPPAPPSPGPLRTLRRVEVERAARCVLDVSTGPAVALVGTGFNPAFGCRLGRRLGAEGSLFIGLLTDLEARGQRWGTGVGGGLALRVAFKADTLFGWYARARLATAKLFYEFRDEVFVLPGANVGYRGLFFDGRFTWDVGAGAQLLWEIQRQERTLSRAVMPILYFRVGLPLPLLRR